MRNASAQPITLGPFRLDPAARRLTRDGTELALGGRAFDTLLALAAASGETISKDSLLATVWPNVAVEGTTCRFKFQPCASSLVRAGSSLFPIAAIAWSPHPPHRRSYSAPQSHPLSLTALPSPSSPSPISAAGILKQEFFSDGIAEGHSDGAIAQSPPVRHRPRHQLPLPRGGGSARGRPQSRHPLCSRWQCSAVPGDALRVTARLNNAASAVVLWSNRYERDVVDIFAVQDEIAVAVSEAVGFAVTEAEQQRARRKPPSDLTVWETYQRGLWHLYRRTESDAHTAIAFLSDAAEDDPGFSGVLIAWSQAVLMLHGNFGVSSFEEGGRILLHLAQRGIDS